MVEHPDQGALQERLAAALAARGMRQTGPRRTVADVFFAAGAQEHLGLEEIHRRARKKDRRIGYATVYRTMKLLAEIGLAFERRFGEGAVRYELAGGRSLHGHLICTNCARIVEFEDARIEPVESEVALGAGFTIQSRRHEIYGLCDRCRT